jgi:hypothetical protein
MRARARALVLAALGGSLLVVTSPGVASAHEDFTVGSIDLAVGFGNEPAYANQPNSVQIILADHGRPVTELSQPMKVEVSFGNDSTTYDVEPNFEVGEFGTPGDFRAFFIPTQVGTYTFHVTGSVDGRKVDVTATSGPKTFSDVIDPAEAEFPTTNAPTTGELATKLDRDSTRVTEAASSAHDAADGARTLAVVALVAGLLGLVLGGVAVSRRRRA